MCAGVHTAASLEFKVDFGVVRDAALHVEPGLNGAAAARHPQSPRRRLMFLVESVVQSGLHVMPGSAARSSPSGLLPKITQLGWSAPDPTGFAGGLVAARRPGRPAPNERPNLLPGRVGLFPQDVGGRAAFVLALSSRGDATRLQGGFAPCE